MIDDVQLVGFLLCLRSCGDDGEDGFAGQNQEYLSILFHLFDHGSGRDCIGRLDQCELIVTGVKELLHALARVAGVKLALEDASNALL